MKSRDSSRDTAQRQPATVLRQQAPDRQDTHGKDAAQPDTLQAAIDRSPRMLTQRHALDMAFGPAIQRQTQEGLEDDEPLQARMGHEVRQHMAADDGEETLLQGRFESLAAQRMEASSGPGGPSPASAAAPVNETGMPNQLKAGIESLSGMDVSDVRVHRNSDKPAQLSALAYAQGNDIHLGPGQEQHLPHEAWHVVQQRQGRVRETVQMAGMAVNDEVGLENEADVMGAKALATAITEKPQASTPHRLSGDGHAQSKMPAQMVQPADLAAATALTGGADLHHGSGPSTPVGFRHAGAHAGNELKAQLTTALDADIPTVFAEYDVNQKPAAGGRDAERIVTGTSPTGLVRIWYTSDHYATFHEIK
jgi:guanyl-specific ribonuclease Sa